MVLSIQGIEVRGAPITRCLVRVNLVDTAGSCRFYNSSISEGDLFRVHDGSKCTAIPAEPGVNYIPCVESQESYPVNISGRLVTNLRFYICEPDLLSKPNLGLMLEILEAPDSQEVDRPRIRVGWAFLPFSGNMIRKHRIVLNRYLFRPPGASAAEKINSQLDEDLMREHRAPMAAYELAANFPQVSPCAIYMEIAEVASLVFEFLGPEN